MDTEKEKKANKKINIIVVVTILIIVFGSIAYYVIKPYYEISKLELIVDLVKKTNTNTNEVKYYRVDDLLNPKSISPLENKWIGRGESSGLVVVERTNQGLKVIIITEDQGHAGIYGYLYSESDKPVSIEQTIYRVGKKVKSKWWKVYYDLG